MTFDALSENSLIYQQLQEDENEEKVGTTIGYA